MFAAVLGQFAANEVERLDAVCAFIDHGDPRIAGELGHAPFFDVAMTAVDLLGLHGHFKAFVGLEALDHWSEQGDEPIGCCITRAVCAVDEVCAPVGQCPRAFGKGLLVHQVAADIGVHDQRVSWTVGIFSARNGAALQAVFGIGDSVLVGGLRLGIALKAHAQTGLVHHGEHSAHAFVRLAHQIARRTVVVHHASRVAVDAHFLFDLTDRNRVTVAE